MTAPIILPPLRDAGFDLIWFGVMMTIVMEMSIIQPQHLRHQKHRAGYPAAGRDLGNAALTLCLFPAI